MKNFKQIVLKMITDHDNTMIWYSEFLTKFNYEERNINAPIGVYYRNGSKGKMDGYTIIINPESFYKLDIEEQIAVLKHEVMHVINLHFFRFTKENGYPDNEINNTAMDIAINGERLNPIIKNLPGSVHKKNSHVQGIFFEDLEDYYGIKNAKKNMHAEYYADLLYKNSAQINGNNNNNNIDSHSIWEESSFDELDPREIEKIQLEELKNIIRETTEKVGKGNAPLSIDNCLIEIDKRLKSKIKWEKILRRKIRNLLQGIGQIKSRYKRHLLYPENNNINGYESDKKPSIVTICDVSGSMGNDEILAGVNEIKNIAKKYNTQIKMIQVDTEVHEINTIKKNTFSINRSGSGGTILEPAFEYIFDKKNRIRNPNIIVVITDGYCESNFRKFKLPNGVFVIWLTTTGNLWFNLKTNMMKIHLKVGDE
jgi:predicted metal-dependent peptidase